MKDFCLVVAFILAIFVGFLVQFSVIGGNPIVPEPYPLGVEQGGTIGNAKYGHVRIKHRVVLKNRLYSYAVELKSCMRYRARINWKLPTANNDGELVAEGMELEPNGDYGIICNNEVSPVWKLAPITLEVRVNGRWTKVGTWYQKGPVPSK